MRPYTAAIERVVKESLNRYAVVAPVGAAQCRTRRHWLSPEYLPSDLVRALMGPILSVW